MEEWDAKRPVVWSKGCPTKGGQKVPHSTHLPSAVERIFGGKIHYPAPIKGGSNSGLTVRTCFDLRIKLISSAWRKTEFFLLTLPTSHIWLVRGKKSERQGRIQRQKLFWNQLIFQNTSGVTSLACHCCPKTSMFSSREANENKFLRQNKSEMEALWLTCYNSVKTNKYSEFRLTSCVSCS